MPARPLALLALAGVLFGCGSGEPLTPADVVGTYTLVRIEGRPVPYVLRSTPDCDFVATGRTLDLRLDSRFEVIVNETIDCGRSGQEPYERGVLYEGQYQMDGERLVLVALASDTRSFDAHADGAQVTAGLPVAAGEPPLLDFVFRRAS